MPSTELSAFADTHCDYAQTAFTHELMLLRYTSYAIVILGFFMQKDIYLLLVSVGILVNSTVVNPLLRLLLRMAPPNGTCGSYFLFCDDPLYPNTTCSRGLFDFFDIPSDCAPCTTPSLEIQASFFVSTALFVFQMMWNTDYVSWFLTTGLILWNVAVIFIHSYVGFNTPLQTLISSLSGVVTSVLWNVIMVSYLYPRATRWRTHSLLTLLGPYKDELTRECPSKMRHDEANEVRYARFACVSATVHILVTVAALAGWLAHRDWVAIVISFQPLVYAVFLSIGHIHELPKNPVD